MDKTQLDPAVQLPLYEAGTAAIEDFVPNLGTFVPFALAALKDGQIGILQLPDEFPDAESAQQGLLSHLVAMRAEGGIIGCLLCVPVEVDSQVPGPKLRLQVAAVMEIEAIGAGPVRVLRQITHHGAGIPELSDEVLFMQGEARVF